MAMALSRSEDPKVEHPAGLWAESGLLLEPVHGAGLFMAGQGQGIQAEGLVQVVTGFVGGPVIGDGFLLEGGPALQVLPLDTVALGGRFTQEETGHGGNPGLGGILTRPVDEPAIRQLPDVQLADDFRKEGFRFGRMLLGKHILGVEQGQAAGGKLFGAGVPIVAGEREGAVDINGREAGQGDLGRLGVVEGKRSFLSGRQVLALDPDHRRIGVADLDGNGLGGGMAGAGGGDRDPRRPFPGRFQFKPDELVAGLVECQFFGRIPGDLDRSFDLDRDASLADVVFHREDIDREGDLLSAAQHARQGRDNHQRRTDGDGFLGIAEGAVMSGHHHDPQAADIHRELDPVGLAAFFQGERPKDADDRVEAVVFLGRRVDLLVTADAEHRGEPAAIAADDLVDRPTTSTLTCTQVSSAR